MNNPAAVTEFKQREEHRELLVRDGGPEALWLVVWRTVVDDDVGYSWGVVWEWDKLGEQALYKLGLRKVPSPISVASGSCTSVENGRKAAVDWFRAIANNMEWKAP